MQLVKEKDKVYILFSNVEKITEDYCEYRDMNMFHLIRKGDPVWFQGDQGAFPLVVEEIIDVKRELPHDTTARNYWGEFRRSHKMIPRLVKLVNKEKHKILKCRFFEEWTDDEDSLRHKSYEFRSFVTAGFLGVRPTKSYIHKSWNLTNDRFLGPNLKDYSINDCFKYYTLIS